MLSQSCIGAWLSSDTVGDAASTDDPKSFKVPSGTLPVPDCPALAVSGHLSHDKNEVNDPASERSDATAELHRASPSSDARRWLSVAGYGGNTRHETSWTRRLDLNYCLELLWAPASPLGYAA